MRKVQHKRISDHFRRSLLTYDEGAKVQKEVGDLLISSLQNYPEIVFSKVLEIGCCTGSMTQSLCETYDIKELWVNDLVKECCERTAERIADQTDTVHPLPGDIEILPLPQNLDLVVSSSTFQWLHDLAGCFVKVYEALSEDGFLVFTLFGPGTMYQVKALTGVGLCYTSEADLVQMLNYNFTILSLSTSHHRMYFQTPRDVLRHIQKTGVGGVSSFRWTGDTLKSFEKGYRNQFGEEQGVPLDYVSTCVVARKKRR